MSSIAYFIMKNDVSCFYAINRKLRCKLLNIFFRNITHLGSTTFAITGALLLLAFYRDIGETLAINLIISQFAIHSIKRIVNRPRPYKTYEWVIALKPPKCRYSFPSGHSACTLTIALVTMNYIPYLSAALLFTAFLVGISRVYLGCHYPTDVFIGFCISYGVFAMSTILLGV